MSRGPGTWQRCLLAATDAAGGEWVPLRWLVHGGPDERPRCLGMNPDMSPHLVRPDAPPVWWEWAASVIPPGKGWSRSQAAERAARVLSRRGLIDYRPRRGMRGPVIRKCLDPGTDTYQESEG
jgi:hypothetical protein